MEKRKDEIYILDSHNSARDSLTNVLLKAGFSAICFSDWFGLFLEARQKQPSCILLDLVTAAATNFEILRSLARQSYPAPVIVLSGNGATIQAAVTAMKLGVYDVVQKPIHKQQLVAKIGAAIEAWRPSKKSGSVESQPIEPLTSREQQVLARLLLGRTNKSIASDLGLSPRTIECHRSKIMNKFAVKSLPQLLLKAVGPGTGRPHSVGPTRKLCNRPLEATFN